MTKRFIRPARGRTRRGRDFGSIDVTTNRTSEVIVEVWRRITRRNRLMRRSSCKTISHHWRHEDKHRHGSLRRKGAVAVLGRKVPHRSKMHHHGPAQFNAQLKNVRRRLSP